MLALIAAIALQGQALKAPAPAPSAPAAPEAPHEMTPAENLAELREVYRESCEVRAYGTYGDMCTSLEDQIAQFERDMRDEARRAKKPRSAAPAPPPAPSPAAAPKSP